MSQKLLLPYTLAPRQPREKHERGKRLNDATIIYTRCFYSSSIYSLNIDAEG